MRWFLPRLFAPLLFVIALGSAARAQDEAAMRARAAFQRGVASYQAGRFTEALEAFNEAYRTKPNPVVLYNIAYAEAELGKLASAIAHFEQYLREAKAIPAERRTEVRREVARLRTREPKLAVDSNVGGSKVVLDGVLLGLTPLGRAVPVDPGPHRLVVSHEGYDDFTQEIMVPPEPGEATRVSARLRAGLARGPAADIEEPRPPTRTPPAAAPVRPPAPPARETPPETPPVAVQPPETPPLPPATRAEPPTLERERRASEGIGRGWFYSGLTATALFATTAIITGGVALSESNEYNDPKTSPARRQVLLDRGPTLAHTTDAFLALTALAAGTTVWLYFKTDWRVTPTPSGVSVAGRF